MPVEAHVVQAEIETVESLAGKTETPSVDFIEIGYYDLVELCWDEGDVVGGGRDGLVCVCCVVSVVST